jgi:hypothetical protein
MVVLPIVTVVVGSVGWPPEIIRFVDEEDADEGCVLGAGNEGADGIAQAKYRMTPRTITATISIESISLRIGVLNHLSISLA